MLLMFVTAALLNAAQINRNYSSIFMDKLQDDTKSMTDYKGDELCEYKALPWLFPTGRKRAMPVWIYRS